MYEDEEVWKEIPEWEGYEVSTWGRVRSYWLVGKRFRPRQKTTDPLILDPNHKGHFLLGGKDNHRRRAPAGLIRESFGLFRCPYCYILLPIEQSGKNNKGHREWQCLKCRTARGTQWRYGMTNKQKQEMLWAQGGECIGGCNRKPTVVHHDHNCCDNTPTCGGCNLAITCQPCNLVLNKNINSEILFNLAEAQARFEKSTL
jgi:hypothetical protein